MGGEDLKGLVACACHTEDSQPEHGQKCLDVKKSLAVAVVIIISVTQSAMQLPYDRDDIVNRDSSSSSKSQPCEESSMSDDLK